jgi:hypothetical protein
MQRRRVALHRGLGRVLTLRSSASQQHRLFPLPADVLGQRQSPSLTGDGAERGADSTSRHQPPARRRPLHHGVDASEPTAGQRRENRQNSEQLRDVGTGEAGALCRPGRTQEKREGVM